MLRECRNCRNKSENLKRCAACSTVWYCNSECQKRNWPIHLVDCNPGRPITTADRLVAFVHRQLPPEDEETRVDYGFTQAPTFEEVEMRLKVYSLLIVQLEVKAKTIHRWTEEGNLGIMMRETFDTRLSLSQRQQEPYIWFCDHQSTFGRDPGPPRANLEAMMRDAHQMAWKFIGGNPSDSYETIKAAFGGFTADHQACFGIVSLVFARMHPAPGYVSNHLPRIWIFFGFCGCADPHEESSLMGRYMSLLERVDYNTFYQAYISSSLPQLLADHRLEIGHPFVLDVLSSRKYKSVWYLKEFVCADDESVRSGREIPFIGVDYGFSNCQDVDEVVALRNAYKQVLLPANADPLALHDACFRGELFDYVGKIARLKPPQLFKRLMKNPYPSGGD